MQISVFEKSFTKLRYVVIASTLLSGCSSGAGSVSSTPPPISSLSTGMGTAPTTDSRFHVYFPSNSSRVASTKNASTKCVDGTVYRSSFNDNFTSFPSVSGVQGQWQTSYLWGRTNPGALDAAFYLDGSVVSRAVQGRNNITTVVPTSNGLHLIASKTPDSLLAQVDHQPYVSGAINSSKLFSQKYGYFEATLTLPSGQGLWPAFWLLPTYGYPPEIDIMENLGNDPTHVYETTHSKSLAVQQSVTNVPNGIAGSHIYGMDWTNASIKYFIDNVKVSTQKNISNQPMYMVFNLAVGNAKSWPGAPNNATAFPAVMSVQNVHAYALTSDHC